MESKVRHSTSPKALSPLGYVAIGVKGAAKLSTQVAQRSRPRHFFYLFLLALFVRFAHFYEVAKSAFLVPSLGLDPGLYHGWARAIADGKGMGTDVFHTMPLYPYFLGLIYRSGSSGLFWAVLIQCLLGAFGVLLVFHIGRTLFNPAVGWIAALGQTFLGTNLFYETLLVPASLLSFLFIATTFLLLWASSGRRLWKWWLTGIVLGLSVLGHAGMLLVLPIVLIWLFLFASGSSQQKGKIMGILLGCVFAAVCAVILRNAKVAQDATFFPAHSGINFYIGNYEKATGRFVPPFTRRTSSEQLLGDAKRFAEEATGRSLKASDVSRFWFGKGLRFIQDHPAGYLKLLFLKLLLFWNSDEIPDVEDYDFFRSRFFVLRNLGLPFGWVAPLGLLGILAGWRHFRKLFLLYGFFLSQLLGILLMFVNSRYRAPLNFAVVIFAAYGFFWCYRLVVEKNYRIAALALTGLLSFFWMTHVDIGKTDAALQYYNIGIVLDGAGEHEAAIETFQKALLAAPGDSAALFALGNAYFRKGDYANARKRYEEAIAFDPAYADVYYNFGYLEFKEGHLKEAEHLLQQSASLKADKPDVYCLLSLLYRKKGFFQKAEDARQKALALGVDPVLLEQELDRGIVR
ncbi:MAG: tetratricopeptide repeat protein [Candidatus Omnitrophota bacterium]